MKRSDEYVLKKIGNTYYLFPCGQKIADLKRGMKINEAGVFLWEHMISDVDLATLQKGLCDYYELSGENRIQACSDVSGYIDTLVKCGVVLSDNCESRNKTHLLEIAGISLNIQCPDEAFSDAFIPFEKKPKAQADCMIVFSEEMNIKHSVGKIVLHNNEVVVFEMELCFIVLFPTMKHIKEMHIMKDNKKIIIYGNDIFGSSMKDEFFHAVRMGYLYAASSKNMFALHSASVLYRDRIWLFSGSSGTGKSTHTNLWKQQFGTDIINGDLNLLAMDGETPIVKGIPWCGTSEISDKGTYQLGGIIFLRQSKNNEIKFFLEDEKAIQVEQRMITPFWTEELLNRGVKYSVNISDKVLICQLFCTKEKDAAEFMRNYIDNYINIEEEEMSQNG